MANTAVSTRPLLNPMVGDSCLYTTLTVTGPKELDHYASGNGLSGKPLYCLKCQDVRTEDRFNGVSPRSSCVPISNDQHITNILKLPSPRCSERHAVEYDGQSDGPIWEKQEPWVSWSSASSPCDRETPRSRDSPVSHGSDCTQILRGNIGVGGISWIFETSGETCSG